MPEPVDLDARHRLGGHGAKAHRRLIAHCQLKPVHEPAQSPTTASSSAGDRGSDVSSARHPAPGQHRQDPDPARRPDRAHPNGTL